jgi:competence CoiA-like predicted nuclease
MPFIAINKDTGHRVDITEYRDPRMEIKACEFVCQLCGERMVLRAGKLVTPHFAHVVACTSDYDAHPESLAHMSSKKAIYNYLQSQYRNTPGVKIEYEVRVPEAERIADVMVTLPQGWRIAHEMQLAGITTESLEKRTVSYARAGIDIYWWLGKGADTKNNRTWCIETLGICGVINVEFDDTAIYIA